MLEQVRDAVASLKAVAADLEPRCLEGASAAALVEVAAEGERVCAAIKGLAARRVDETNVWKNEGHRSGAHWLADKTGETVGAAVTALKTAEALDELRATREAFCSGELSGTQAAEIASAAIEAPEAEHALLEAAGRSSVKGLRDHCREVRAGAQTDDEAWARRLHDRRRAHEWSEPDGAYCFGGRLAPDAGTRFSSAWQAHTERIFREARAAGRREPRAAYMADALVALATEGPMKPPELRVVVDHAALRRGHVEGGERCEITGVGPAPVITAREMLDDATVTLIMQDGDDITTVSRPTRTIPTKFRKALETRYAACGVRGCANDRRLEIDHIVPLHESGRTELENLWRICSHHHTLKSYFGWRVAGPPGDRDLVAPDDPDPP